MILAALAVSIWPEPVSRWLHQDRSVAQIITSKSAVWGSCELPTTLGSRLEPGVLNLTQGMVTLAFDCGGTISVQGPASLQIVDSTACRLLSGRLTGRMEKGKSGLTVLTQKAKLVDMGTEFGISVDEAGECRLVVFDGEVACELTKTGEVASVRGGSSVRIDAQTIQYLNDQELSDMGAQSTASSERTGEVFHVTTGYGRGRDRFIVQNPAVDEYVDDGTMLLAKEPFAKLEGWRRKVYLGFDLTGVALDALQSAELNLSITDSKIGFAERCPDATFNVYGLTDEALDDWRPENISWHNAPGNAPDAGRNMDESKVTRLGKFLIQQGQSSGLIKFNTIELQEFLKHDTNRLVTLMIVRETAESAGNGTAHAFASSRHPNLLPPTLRLVLKP